ncbi:MAG: lauroyl acyltransferase [Alphaproteobacteria bacterium]|nr:lauroyl acyltransferase [Alphaproteobacteria bacterium]MDE2337629.1 lauroyl acyltransferase [Alphaproteobacteria bacterium]
MQSALPFFKRLRYALETAGAYAVYGFFRLLPPDAASAAGGFIMRRLGPHLPSAATARKNLACAFPEKSVAAREEILRGMWDNIGRTAAEYAHLHRIWERVELTGREYLDAVRESGKPAIFCGAHLANWEVNAIAAKKHGVGLHVVYRRPNNPGVDGLLRHARNSGAAAHIEKGARGAKEMLAVLKKNGVLGLLVDQKLNEGIPAPFFGTDAMTTTAPAQFALHFNCPVHPAQVVRTGGCRFRMTIFPALDMPATGDRDADARAITFRLNALIEGWVREYPEQWLWIHKRWPD